MIIVNQAHLDHASLIMPSIGHPSCLDLGQLGDVIRSYPWKCVECKNCEVCQEKGGDVRICSLIMPYFLASCTDFLDAQTRMLFCDVCDRGVFWMYCQPSCQLTLSLKAGIWNVFNPHSLKNHQDSGIAQGAPSFRPSNYSSKRSNTNQPNRS